MQNQNNAQPVQPQPADQNQQQQQQQQQPSRGGRRGGARGGRGRGGRGGIGAGNYTQPGVITRLTAGLVPIVRPSSSFYIIELHLIIELFIRFGTFIVALPRRGNWQAPGYYAGLFLFALAAKLQRVGIATNQLFTPSQHMLTVSELLLPSAVVTLIDQFGVKTDPAGVVIAPYVTADLVSYLSRLSYLLAGYNSTGGQNPNTILWLPANVGNIYLRCYSDIIIKKIVASKACAELGVGVVFFGNSDYTVNTAILASVNEYITRNGLNRLTAAETDTLLGIVLNQQQQIQIVTTPLLQAIAIGGQPLLQAGNIPVAVVAAFNRACAALLNGADLFANNDGYAGYATMTIIPGEYTLYSNEQVELAHRFHLSPVPVSPSGSFAPLVAVSQLADKLSADCVCAGLTAMEWALGMVINAASHMCTRDGNPFNVTDAQRRIRRYSIPPVDFTFSSLAMTYIRESLLSQ